MTSTKTRTCLSCGAKAAGDVCRPKVITSVKVEGEKPRKVFYVRREVLFDAQGRVCHSPDTLAMWLAASLVRRDVESVDGIVWDALNFIHNGDVPKDWLRKRQKENPVPLAI